MNLDHGDPEHAGQLHHLEWNVPDIKAAEAFWGWFLGELGYDRKNKWEGGRSWRRGPSYLVINEVESVTPFDRRDVGLNHLAFHATSQAQVDTLYDGVCARSDASVLYKDQHPYAGGYYALYCEDPMGLKVEVVAPIDEN